MLRAIKNLINDIDVIGAIYLTLFIIVIIFNIWAIDRALTIYGL